MENFVQLVCEKHKIKAGSMRFELEGGMAVDALDEVQNNDKLVAYIE
jgi:hypothetical protein